MSKELKSLMKLFVKYDDIFKPQDIYNFKAGNYKDIISRLDKEYSQIDDSRLQKKYLKAIQKLKKSIKDYQKQAYKYNYKNSHKYEHFEYWFNFYLEEKLVGKAESTLQDIKNLDEVSQSKIDSLEAKLTKYKEKYNKQIQQIQQDKAKKQKIMQVKNILDGGDTSRAMKQCLDLLDEYPNDKEIKKLREHIDEVKSARNKYDPSKDLELSENKNYQNNLNGLDKDEKEENKKERKEIYDRLEKIKKQGEYRQGLKYISDIRREKYSKDLKLIEYYKEFSEKLQSKKKKEQQKKFKLECKTAKLHIENGQYNKALKKLSNILQHYPLIKKDNVYKLIQKTKKLKSKSSKTSSSVSGLDDMSDLEKWLGNKLGLGRKALDTFYDKLAWFLKSEMDIKIALRTVHSQVKDMALKIFLKDLIEGLESGIKISDIMNEYEEIDNFSKALIRIGENTGQLGDMFELINQSRKEARERRKKIKGVMMYPAIVIGITVLIFVGLMIFIIPKFVGFYEEVGVELPTLTKGVLAISNFIRYRWYLIIVFLVGTFVGLKVFGKTDKGKRVYSRLALNTIIVKEIVHRKYIVFFTGKLALLLSSGVNLLNAFDMLIYGTDNILFREELLRIKYEVQSGVSIAEAIGIVDVGSINNYNNPYIPINVAYSIDIGEQSGQLGDVLRDIEQIYDEELHHIIENLQSLMEPVIIFVLGIFVALFVASIFLPMIGMYNALGEMGGL